MLNIPQSPSGGNGGRPPLFSMADTGEASRARAWLDGRLRRSALHGFSSESVTLSPILAELLLDRNPDNRVVKQGFVDRYAADIKNGDWSFNGEAVKVSVDGHLNDGQHRCLAVIAAGRSIQTIIQFGLPRESRLTLDQGSPRTAGDYLSMDGIDNANTCAATATLIFQYVTSGRVSHQSHLRPTKSQVQETVRKHPEIASSIRMIPNRGSNLAGGKSVLAFSHFILRRLNEPAATHFITKLVNGDGLTTNDPIYLCREALRARKRLTVEEKVELIFRAWNHHRCGSRLKKLQISYRLPELEG